MPTSDVHDDAPFCSNCGYALTGAIESSKCPECGRPLVEVLRRPSFARRTQGRRYRSSRTLFGLPLVDVATGPHADGPHGKARGFFAIGDEARGVIAIGGQAYGGLCIGGSAVGVIAIGGAAVGAIALGGSAIGGVAVGGAAIGLIAAGRAVIGVFHAAGAAAYALLG